MTESKEVAVAQESKTPMVSGGQIAAIVPKDHAEAFRFAEAFLHAGMIPASYAVKRNAQGKEVKEWEDGILDERATRARIGIGIMKGMEIGLPPITALSTICVINNRPCLWGDGAAALIQKSGKCEWMTDRIEGDWMKGTYQVTFTVKRIDQEEPVARSFSQADAKTAGLLTKKGPWSQGYGPRMCLCRARAWAFRDAFSDVLMGIGIAEEVRDQIEQEHVEPQIAAQTLDVGLGVAPLHGDNPAPALLEPPVVEQPQVLAKPEDTAPVEKDDLEKAMEAPHVDPDDEWKSVIAELTGQMLLCKDMASYQLFFVDNQSTIDNLKKAPQSIQDTWANLHKSNMDRIQKLEKDRK